MTLNVSIGSAQALNGREAGLQAAHQALNKLGSAAADLGFIIASHQYQARDVVSGVASLLGDTPVIGFSSPAGLTSEGLRPNSVVVALLSGDFQAETQWMPTYAQSARETGAKLAKQLAEKDNRGMIFFADGFNGDADQLCSVIKFSASRRRSFRWGFAYGSFLPIGWCANWNRRSGCDLFTR